MIQSNIVDDFLSYLTTTKGISENTAREYYYDIRTFLKFILIRKEIVLEKEIDNIDIDIVDFEIIRTIDKMDVYAYNSYLDRVRKNTNKTKYRKISAIRTFFNYLCNKIEVIEVNPVENIDMPKIEKTLPVYLSLEEAKKLLDAIVNSKTLEKNKLRDFAIVTLFLNCGMRLSELSGLNMEDIKKDKTMKVMGKGKKERTIYLNDACLKAIDDYFIFRKKEEGKALFLSNKKNRISNRQIQRIIEKYICLAGLDPRKYTVHKLRHTAATLMYQYGNADIRSLQEILGHESVTTTQIYTHVNDKQLRATVENNPLSNLSYKNNKNS